MKPFFSNKNSNISHLFPSYLLVEFIFIIESENAKFPWGIS